MTWLLNSLEEKISNSVIFLTTAKEMWDTQKVMFGNEKNPSRVFEIYVQRSNPAGTETLLRRIYAGWKYPHVYTLSFSTDKNQSTKVRGALYIPTCGYNYKVITRCDTILQEYYITDMRKCENIKSCTSMNSTNDAHDFIEGKLERRARGLKG